MISSLKMSCQKGPRWLSLTYAKNPAHSCACI